MKNKKETNAMQITDEIYRAVMEAAADYYLRGTPADRAMEMAAQDFEIDLKFIRLYQLRRGIR